MSIKVMEMALEALEVRCGTNADERKTGGVIEALRTTIQQAEAHPREPVYQICKADSVSISTAWVDVQKQQYDDAALYPEYGRRVLYAHPAQGVQDALKDHQIAAMVNTLRDIARQFHGHDSLRERIANVLVPALKAEAQQPATAIACGVPGMAKTTCPYCEQGFAFEHEQPATGEPVKAERDQLRCAQADAVMPLIGPLLDAWENVDREVISQEPELSRQLKAINNAMEDAQPATTEPVVSRNPFASRCYTMSESHLSGHRLIVGFEKLGDAQDAHEWVARQGRGDFTHFAQDVPDDVVRDAISTVREQYRGTDLGKAAESICDAINAAIDAAMLADRP